ncbi:MAG: enoyl-CoA hydratase/isomerase family protein [Zoogloeaceae bacterium]|jgi:enoyl-CoA hydratase/carnithine racemase|nr:enoyl-CoA hydratase/isomerase family protein [Zoogloeaceae bacterium]
MHDIKIKQIGKVSLFTIDRPQKRNAFNQDVVVALQDAFRAFDVSEQRVAVLTGSGDEAFSAGGDLNQFPEYWRCMPGIGVTTEKPIIAATAGWVVGGGLVLAMLCDLLVAAENSRFYYPEARLGVTGGAIAGLAARIPHKIAMEVMLLGRELDARRAYEVGLVNQVTPVGKQVETALEIAAELAESSPLVLKTLKRFVNQHILPKGPSEIQGEVVRQLWEVNSTADAKEGLAAKREKRAPRFTGQ